MNTYPGWPMILEIYYKKIIFVQRLANIPRGIKRKYMLSNESKEVGSFVRSVRIARNNMVLRYIPSIHTCLINGKQCRLKRDKEYM